MDFFNDTDALKLLSEWSGKRNDELPPEAKEAAKECGNLPLALAMAGAIAREDLHGWKGVLHRLKQPNLQKIQKQFPHYPYPNLLKAIEASVNVLPPEERSNYIDLAIFPDNIALPEPMLRTYWGLDEYDTWDNINLFVRLSLGRLDENGCLILHDLQHDYIANNAAKLANLHNKLILAYKDKCNNSWSTGPNDGYFFHHFAYHLIQAGKREEFTKLYKDDIWIKTRLRNNGISSLLSEMKLLSEDEKRDLGISIYIRDIDFPSHKSESALFISICLGGGNFKINVFNITENDLIILDKEIENYYHEGLINDLIRKYEDLISELH